MLSLKQTLAAVATGAVAAVVIATPINIIMAANAATRDRVEYDVKPASEELAKSYQCVFSVDCK